MPDIKLKIIIQQQIILLKMKNILLTAILIFGFTTISIAQVPAYVPTNGLVSWWPFTGNANDFSGNGNNGTVFYATLTTDRNNQLASAYNFDCSNGWDEIYIPYNSSFNSPTITISAWFYSSTLYCNGDAHAIIRRFQNGYNNPNGEAWGLTVGQNSSLDGFIKTQSPSNQGYLSSTGPGALSNQWVNVILSFDGTLLKQYINGQLYDTDSSPGFLLNITGNSGISIGVSDQANGHWAPFDGKLDDIGIWNRALTACEINNLYTSGSVTTTTTSASICIGASTTITASGASTYTWMPGNLTGSTITVSPITTTTYTVTGTDAQGCINSATRIITVNPLPVVTTTTTAATICIGASTTITASGATTYAWMPGNLTGATVTVSPIATTTYTVTGTNANGCINTTTRIITVNPLPVVTATSTAAAVCAGASVTLNGGGATSYTWNNNVTNAVSFVPTATATYTVTGTNANACVNTATITVTVNPLPVVTATSTSAAVCNGGSVTLTGGGAVTYAWSGGVTNAVSFIPSATTTYTVTGTNSNGCVNTATTTVTVNPLPAVTANSSAASVCAGGSVTLTGGGAATYTWSNNVMNAVSFIPNSTATYTVTGTDANGCMNTAVIMVIVSTLPTVTATSTAAAVCAGASVTLTGGGAATYSWTNNVTDAVSFIPTQTITYTVTGTSSAGCVNTTTITVTVNPLPVVTATSTAAAVCAGSSVILSGGGAATYSWSGGVTNAVSFIPTATTTYTVTGTNSNGCVNTAMITVTVNPLPIVTATSTAAAVCIGGSVTLTGGGAATYSWDNNVIDAVTFVPSATMTYVVTGTDLNACINTATITVTVNPLPVVIATSTAAAVCAGASVTLTGSGASTYVWDNNVIDAVTFVPVATATYNVIGTDLNGCVNISSITVTVNISPIVSLGPDVIQCGGTVTLNAGNTGSTYLWSNLNTIQSITVSTSGIYSVVVTNTNGCIGSDLVNVIINVLPVVTGSVSANVVCVDDAVLSLVGTPIGGVWSGPGVNGLFLSPLAAGVGSHIAIYSYTDSNGCEGMASVNVQVNACVGFVENALANGVSVYPNPNNGSFTLSVNANVAELTIKITDMQGRVVYASVENNVNAGFVKQISLDTQSSGMYLMHILANGEQQTKKISVQK